MAILLPINIKVELEELTASAARAPSGNEAAKPQSPLGVTTSERDAREHSQGDLFVCLREFLFAANLKTNLKTMYPESDK